LQRSFGSIGRISEIEVQSLMHTAIGQLTQAVVRPIIQITDTVGGSAADGDG
jgi:hypothetical protein